MHAVFLYTFKFFFFLLQRLLCRVGVQTFYGGSNVSQWSNRIHGADDGCWQPGTGFSNDFLFFVWLEYKAKRAMQRFGWLSEWDVKSLFVSDLGRQSHEERKHLFYHTSSFTYWYSRWYVALPKIIWDTSPKAKTQAGHIVKRTFKYFIVNFKGCGHCEF